MGEGVAVASLGKLKTINNPPLINLLHVFCFNNLNTCQVSSKQCLRIQYCMPILTFLL